MTTSRFEAGEGLLGRLNHVGIAVPDMDAACRSYRALFGADTVGAPFDVPAQGVSVCFVAAPNADVELVAPLGEASPLANFLRRSPAGGQHHLCFEVQDIAAAQAAFAAIGVRALGSPRPGAHGAPVLFLHPKDMGGVLVELMEAGRGGE